MTVANMKIGDKLVFGRYGLTDDVESIVWLKANKENCFISEKVIAKTQTDRLERFLDDADFSRGLIFNFSLYELQSINKTNDVYFDIPNITDLFGENALSLFKRRGVRAEATDEFVRGSKYRPYALRSDCDRIYCLNGMGNQAVTVGYTVYIRPKCTIKSDMKIEKTSNGMYCSLYEVDRQNELSADNLMSFLGL